ncbi:MAG: non-canonical purine NTP pyrophosphatase [Deltaproteobacteria bacterium]|nr:non-canonical purine NTP pyrophosphatase [Deltaproteobacteria bacterium]
MAETETRTLAVATGNAHKRSELEAMLAPLGVTVVLARDHGLGEVVEDGDTFAANALKKAREGYEVTGFPCLADDSGLEVDALGGAPGVISARWAGPGQDDAANNDKLVRELAGVPPERRGARFVSSLALVVPAALAEHAGDGPWAREELADLGAVAFSVEGTVPGRMLDAPRGGAGFGYDPYFLYEPAGKTFAELSQDEKLGFSHRGRAMRALDALLRQLFG